MGLLEKERLNILKYYTENKNSTLKETAKHFKRDIKTIYKILKVNNISTKRKSHLYRRNLLDENVFDNITEESAYWIGFLMADGCICNTKHQDILSLKLAAIDAVHIEKFKEFLKSSHKITFIDSNIIKHQKSNIHDKPQSQVSFSVASDKLCNKLKEYGVVERKSMKEKVSDDLKFNKHFYRGCIDGDGTLYEFEVRNKQKYNYPRIVLNGSFDLITQFKNFCFTIVGNSGSMYKAGPIFRFSLKGKKAQQVIDLLYKDNSISLARKMQIAKSIIGET